MDRLQLLSYTVKPTPDVITHSPISSSSQFLCTSHLAMIGVLSTSQFGDLGSSILGAVSSSNESSSTRGVRTISKRQNNNNLDQSCVFSFTLLRIWRLFPDSQRDLIKVYYELKRRKLYSGTWPSNPMDLLSLRLAGEVGARINVRSSYAHRGPAVAWISTQVSRLQTQRFHD